MGVALKRNWGYEFKTKNQNGFLERMFWFLSIIVLDQNSPMSHPQ